MGTQSGAVNVFKHVYGRICGWSQTAHYCKFTIKATFFLKKRRNTDAQWPLKFKYKVGMQVWNWTKQSALRMWSMEVFFFFICTRKTRGHKSIHNKLYHSFLTAWWPFTRLVVIILLNKRSSEAPDKLSTNQPCELQQVSRAGRDNRFTT